MTPGEAARETLSAQELAAERRLIEASQKDPRRFAQLYERYFHRVYAFAIVRTRDRAAAEDLTAETFRRAFQNLRQFEWRGVPFSAWLFRIAANVATEQGRRIARERVARQAVAEEQSKEHESWETHLIEVESRLQLVQLVERLPADQRWVITLRFAEEMSVQEMAKALGRSEGAVKQLQFRALRTLREWVRKSHD